MIKEINITNIDEYHKKKVLVPLINIIRIKNDLKSNPFSKYIVFILNNDIVAFTNYLIIYDKVEIVNIVVNKNFRCQNIASMMINYILKEAVYNNCNNITLEVRKSNKAAIALYKKFGFLEVAIRKNYYNGENGLLMEKKLVI